MNIAIVQYNAGNIRSVRLALERLGHTPLLTANASELAAADKVIFPGVGAAGAAMTWLRQHQLDVVLRQLKQPVLGICLGMQLLAQHSAEDETPCLGVLPGRVRRFPASSGKVPQIGWNQIRFSEHPLFEGLPQACWMYFVHGYYLPLGENTLATTQYGISYSAAVQYQNYHAVQFHPERSGTAGARLLQNFLNL